MQRDIPEALLTTCSMRHRGYGVRKSDKRQGEAHGQAKGKRQEQVERKEERRRNRVVKRKR